jgi:hypothetical protein
MATGMLVWQRTHMYQILGNLGQRRLTCARLQAIYMFVIGAGALLW